MWSCLDFALYQIIYQLIQIFQIFSLLICLVSSVFCLVSTISHLLHLLTLMSASCDPPLKTPVSWPQHSCLCLSQSRLWRHGELVYPGTDCDHLLSIQPPLLIILILLNIISMFCSFIFMLLLACSKHNLTFRNWRNIKNYEVTRLGGELRWHRVTQVNSISGAEIIFRGMRVRVARRIWRCLLFIDQWCPLLNNNWISFNMNKKKLFYLTIFLWFLVTEIYILTDWWSCTLITKEYWVFKIHKIYYVSALYVKCPRYLQIDAANNHKIWIHLQTLKIVILRVSR